MPTRPAFPDGHFYSPVVDVVDLADRDAALWPERPELIGMDFNDDSHLRILREVFPRFIGDYTYPEDAPADDDALDCFYTRNSQFSWLDSRALFVLMREWRPSRIIEVGSGYSSLLMADVNRRFLSGACQVTCIEPFPREFLKRGVDGLHAVTTEKVQDVPLETFDELVAGDVLFVDSSHVAKTGSDVNHLFFEVIPRLRPGVRVHVHDIFLPHEYPRQWVLEENRSWNEQYLLRAMLTYSRMLRVVFGSSYAFYRFPEEVRRALAPAGGGAYAGGSLWMERC